MNADEGRFKRKSGQSEFCCKQEFQICDDYKGNFLCRVDSISIIWAKKSLIKGIKAFNVWIKQRAAPHGFNKLVILVRSKIQCGKII